MEKCIFYTYAYNAEKTVERTIRSVMAQSGDWVYHIVDNGSTDGTGDVIRRVATEDSRIVPCINQKNMVWESGNAWWDLVQMYEPDDYLCIVDADDTYKSDFLSTMQSFSEENHLDIAVCGNEFLDVTIGKVQSVRSLREDLVLHGRGFSYYFPVYHQFMRTVWAKLFRINVLRQIDHTKLPDIVYGLDTIITTHAFQNAQRVGILGKALYEYYISPTSVSYRSGEKRAEPLEPLYNAAESLLESKCGRVTDRNRDFLTLVYLNDTKDALRIILNAEDSVTNKLDSLSLIFESRPMQLTLQAPVQELSSLAAQIKNLKPEVLQMVQSWLLSLDEVPDEKVPVFCRVGIVVSEALNDTDRMGFFRQIISTFC